MTTHAVARPLFRGPLAGQRPRRLGQLAGDPWLVLAVAALVAFGLVMVFNASWFQGQEQFGDPLHFFRKHVLSVGFGLVGAFVASRLSSDVYRRVAYPVLLVALAGLVLVLVPGVGVERGGAQRWLQLGPLNLQPSELAKLAFVLYLAASLTKKGEAVETFRLGVVPHAVVAGTMAVLLLLEPDFGGVVLVVGLLGFVLVAGGVRLRYLALPALAGLPAIAWLAMAESYRKKRLIAFFWPADDPLGINFQLNQSFIAFGSGGFWGVGLGDGRQKMFYLPAAHTDFIYSVIGEELGLLGALVVLALFGVVAVRGFRIALRHTDRFASLLAFGVTVSLLLQAVVNMGVVLGCLPTKGLPLPFLSYGGSAMMAALVQVGVLVALARETE